MSEILQTIREWIEIQGKELLAAADAHNREDERVEAGKYNMLKAVENLIETSSPWRDFRKERPADGQYVHFRCEGEDETEHAWYSEEQRRIKGPMIDIYPDQLSWFLWQPYVEPAPPTASEIEAAMKGDGNAG